MKHFRKKKVSKATSYRMSRITGKNTNPERYVRSVLHKNGFRFSLHKKNLPGKPDIVLTKYKTVINVNGCFWHQHGCRYSVIPKSNKKYWELKLKNNTLRDEKNLKKLNQIGVKYEIIWECQIKQQLEKVVKKMIARIKK